jgi:hypothetical protein
MKNYSAKKCQDQYAIETTGKDAIANCVLSYSCSSEVKINQQEGVLITGFGLSNFSYL